MADEVKEIAKTSTSTGNKRNKGQGPKGKPKRFRPNNNPGGLTYEKATPPTTLSTTPRIGLYKLHISTKYFVDLCLLTFQTIASRDSKMKAELMPEELAYASLIALHYRIISVAAHYGYKFAKYSSSLKLLAEGVCLPDFLCKAIESVGLVTVDCLATFVPHVCDLDLERPDLVHLRELLYYIQQEHPPQPDDDVQQVTLPSPAIAAVEATEGTDAIAAVPAVIGTSFSDSLDNTVFERLAMSMGRGIRTGIVYRHVNFSEYAGKPEFIVTRKPGELGSCVGLFPCIVENSVAEQGAIYGFRNWDDKDLWLGDGDKYLSYMHTSRPFMLKVLSTERITHTLGSA